ncbi:MAG: hypothetical protein V1678_02720 [Candidatus Aenigmatarchaeota archaeon]
MFKPPAWMVVIIALNLMAVALYFMMNKDTYQSSSQNNPVVKPADTTAKPANVTKAVTKTNTTKISNQTNTTVYTSRCLDSIGALRSSLKNISSLRAVKTAYYNNTDDAIKYVQSLTNRPYELVGVGKDIFDANRSTISLSEVRTSDGKNFTLPLVCSENGTIGKYSKCMLGNITDIDLYCHSLTEDMSECDLENLNYGYWDDITYFIKPTPGTLNTTQLFNFTITSSRNRLEYGTLFIDYERPGTYKNLFNKSLATAKGDKISITTTLNLTGKIYGGLKITTYFKKKCFKYQMLSQYEY